MISIADVRQLDTLIDGQMTGLNTPFIACATIPAADQAAWAGFYASWKTLHTYWTDLDTYGWLNLYLQDFLISNSVYRQMNEYAAQLPMWQAKVTAACPGSYTAPPPILIPTNPTAGPKPFDWDEFVKMAGGVVTTVALAGIVYKGLTIVEDFTSNVRKA